MESWMLGPPLLIGERVFYVADDGIEVVPGVVRWLGRIQECFGNQMIAGVALVYILRS